MLPPMENSQLYNMHVMQRASFAPLAMMANASKVLHGSPLNPFAYTGYGRSMAAAAELMERMMQNYPKPEFGITHVDVGGKRIAIRDEVIKAMPFCNLRHFARDGKSDLPKMLIVAPMSGHHSTLLRGTVQDLLPHLDVYITDWKDAREIPHSEGKFDLDDYVTYVRECIRHIGAGTHTMAVCQPSVPLLAAAAVMAADKDPLAPASMTLIGGPIDTREAPTQVNTFAKEHPMSWFESNVITRVPFNYPGFMRRVYPGFLQLSGFMSMNMERHVGEHVKLFQHLVAGDGESAAAHRKFYNEYLSVADLPAEFYLQTMDVVFHRHLLPEGKMMYGDQRVEPKAITKTALLTLEGELDDISGVGQTKAAHKICSGLPDSMRKHHMQKGVGHYGIFNGRKFRELVVPIITDFVKSHD